jgi:hypothetical protein
MTSLMLRSLYPRGKSPRYAIDIQLGGPQNQFGCCGEEKICAYEQGSNIDSLVVLWDFLEFTTYFPKYKRINSILFGGMSVL